MRDDEFITFSDNKENSSTSLPYEASPCWNMLVVDDDKAVHDVTRLVLKNATVFNRNIVIHSAYSAHEAKELLFSNVTFAFALIDVVMETDTAGLSLIKWIRDEKRDTNIRLVLRTGQPGEAPEQDIISHYDIHDYKEKNELTAKKLFTLSYSCLRTYNDIIKAKEMQTMLRHSVKMEAIGQLASGIVHDFNNILGVILGNVELLQQTPFDNEKQTRRVNSIHKAAMMGKNTTDKLRSFTTNKSAQKKSVNINDLIKSMDTIIDHSTTRNSPVNYDLDNNLWLTNIASNDFEAALLNLIINANEAIIENGYISIKTRNCILTEEFCLENSGAISGEYILLTVRDNGKGISTKDKKLLFDPFFTTKKTGTGLGLAMVFDFINRSLGYITVNSEIELDTTFNLYLPRNHKRE
ncbi:MAG: hypothetical protein HRT52_21575 [Colwellia sp.]|nr:hypothetical protein [Colwellia sp.]